MKRWPMVGLLWLIAVAQAGASGAVPADIVAETRLGPAAGNGTHPFAAAVDTRRNRLWVLNRVPQSLTVVDLNARRMIAEVPLAAPRVPLFDGWFNSEPRIWIGYDAGADHVLVGAGATSVRSVLISVDAGTRKIGAVRPILDRYTYRCALNTKRGEVAVAGMGRVYRSGFGVLVMDAKTLETHADFATNQIEAMAASGRTGQWLTVEPSNPQPASIGMGGPYSATRVLVRDQAGAIVARSPGEYAYPRALFVDDAGGRLYLAHRRLPCGVRIITSDSNALAVLSQSTLQRERTIQYADLDPNSGREVLPWADAWLDAPRHRVVADLYSGRLGVLPLTGPSKATRVPVEGSLFSEYRLAGVLKRTGQPILLIDNAVRLLNSRTLQAGAGITLGATIQDLFLDEKQHRLLAQVDRDIREFLMLENNVPRRLFKSYLIPETHLLAVDFDRQKIYCVRGDGWGSAASLTVMNFLGAPTAGGYRAEGEFAGLIVTDTPGRSFRLLYPTFPESVHALKRFSLDLLENGREIKSVALPQSTILQRPPQLLYAARADRVYVVAGHTMTIYAGSDLASLGTLSLTDLSVNRSQGELAGSLAVDAEGSFAYYADPEQRQIAKLRLTDGSVVARRELTFAPTQPLVDTAADRLYVADNGGGRVVVIHLF